jgi:saccharopine dehydrogenase (NADP+, L-glutamate forming)
MQASRSQSVCTARHAVVHFILTHAACRTLDSAKKLASGLKNTRPISLDVTDSEALDAEVAKADLVISLIPYTFHIAVIKLAIRKKKNVATTSYISPAMLELEKEAKEAGITVMNEIGLDRNRPSLCG